MTTPRTPSSRFNGVATELLYVALAVSPFVIYKQVVLAQQQAGAPPMPSGHVTQCWIVALVVGYYLSFRSRPHWTLSSLLIYLWVAGMAAALSWYQIPVTTCAHTLRFYFVGHLWLCQCVRLHAVALGFITTATTLGLAYDSSLYSLAEEAPTLLGWSGTLAKWRTLQKFKVMMYCNIQPAIFLLCFIVSYMVFHYMEWQAAATHRCLLWSAFCGSLTYLLLVSTTPFILKHTSVWCTKEAAWTLGVLVVGGIARDLTARPTRAPTPAPATTRIQSLQTASLILNLSGTAVAIVDGQRRIKVASDAFGRMVDPLAGHGGARVSGLVLEDVLRLGESEASQFQAWFQASNLTSSTTRVRLRNHALIEVALSPGPDSASTQTGFMIVLVNLTEQQAAEQEALKARRLIETIETLSQNQR